MEFSKGRFRVRLSQRDGDVVAAQRLRHRAFRGGDGVDADAFDAACQHLLIEAVATGELVGTCRLHLVRSAALLGQTYTGQFYDLSVFSGFSGPLLEVGRFCMAAGGQDADALRLAWAALTRIVDGEGVALLFGCSSFSGTDPAPHADALAALACHHLAPPALRPGRKATETVPLVPAPHDMRRSLAQMPPLLRSYLAMGGRVSDHAVVDRDLGTLHVCTGVEIAAIPPARARLLRADAG
jgi:putative hemolysin